MKVRIVRQPAGLICINQGHLLEKDLNNLFNDYAFEIVQSQTHDNRIEVVFDPRHEFKVRSIVNNWMSVFTVDLGNQIKFIEQLKGEGKVIKDEHIYTASITAEDVLYEDIQPITNAPTNGVIEFIFAKKIKNSCDYQYLNLMQDIRDNGTVKTDRTGTGTKSVFGRQMRFDLNEGIPLLTTKKIHLPSVIHELIWFLNGDTNIKYLNDNGVTIWNEWADANGDLGPVYGAQWRSWHDVQILHPERHADKIEQFKKLGYLTTGSAKRDIVPGEYVMMEKFIDQISEALSTLKNNPDSRRIIVSSWNVPELPLMKLMPCHSLFQFYVTDLTIEERMVWAAKNVRNYGMCFYTGLSEKEEEQAEHTRHDELGVPRQRLSCQLYQRSCDVFLGLPFNVASYAILTHMFAQQLNMTVGDFVWTGGDTHLYKTHAEQVEKQLARTWREMPKLKFARKPNSIFDYKFDDFIIENYDPHPGIKAPVAV